MFPAIAALLIQRHLIDFNDFLILVYILIIPVIICLKIRSSDSVSCIHWGPVLAVESTNKTATMIKRRRDPFFQFSSCDQSEARESKHRPSVPVSTEFPVMNIKLKSQKMKNKYVNKLQVWTLVIHIQHPPKYFSHQKLQSFC